MPDINAATCSERELAVLWNTMSKTILGSWDSVFAVLRDRIVADAAAALPTTLTEAQFAEWFTRNMPNGTVIGDAEWWAARAWRLLAGAAAVRPDDAAIAESYRKGWEAGAKDGLDRATEMLARARRAEATNDAAMREAERAVALVNTIRARISYDTDQSFVRLEFRRIGDAEAFERAMRDVDPPAPLPSVRLSDGSVVRTHRLPEMDRDSLMRTFKGKLTHTGFALREWRLLLPDDATGADFDALKAFAAAQERGA